MPSPRTAPFPDNDPRHGTYAGVSQHKVHRTPQCGPCALAGKLYMRQRRTKKASKVRFTYPIAMTLAAYDLDGVGIAIARAIRESA